MIKIYSSNSNLTQEKAYCSLSLSINVNGNYVFTLDVKNKKSIITFIKDKDLNDRLRSWIENLENKYNLIRLF